MEHCGGYPGPRPVAGGGYGAKAADDTSREGQDAATNRRDVTLYRLRAGHLHIAPMNPGAGGAGRGITCHGCHSLL